MESTRDKVAFALFFHICAGSIDDDLTFPQRNWENLPTDKRASWYRHADVALKAASSITTQTPKGAPLL